MIGVGQLLQCGWSTPTAFLLVTLGRNVALLLDILLAAVVGVSPPAPVASAAKAKQTFTVYRNFPGQYQLGIDDDSFELVGDAEVPLVLLSVQLIMEKPVKYIDTPAQVKSYQNSLAVDCRNDRVFVLVGRAFDVKGKLIYTTKAPQIVNNPHEKTTPTTEIMNLICPPILERYKDFINPPAVTSPSWVKTQERDIVVM